MDKIKTSKKVEEIYNKIITERLLDHTCQFFIQTPDGYKPFGSGVFVALHDAYFIFTASHVADKLIENDNDLYIRIESDAFINVIGKVKYTNTESARGIDLAYIKLDEQIVSPLINKYKFLTIDKIRKHDNLLVGAANYCVMGFPENNIDYETGELITTAQAYFTFPTNDNPYEYYRLSKNDWIILQMSGKAEDVTTKERLPMNTHLYGISGCGLWLMLPNTHDNSCDYRLVGIMTDYKKDKYYCLIGNKIHLLLAAISFFENMKFKALK
jgi:hypothetical protein